MNLSIKQMKAECVWFLFLCRVSSYQRCSETPPSMTNRMDIRCHHSAKGHCYLQYSHQYSTSFVITNWFDSLFSNIFCSDMMSMNRSWPKTTMQLDDKLTTKLQYNPKISKLWAILARIQFAPQWLWWTCNVPPLAIHRAWAVISRCTLHASSTAWKQSSHWANIIHLYFKRTTSDTPRWPPISHPSYQFELALDHRGIQVSGIADVPPWLEITWDTFDTT
jgi:hypothetical protein